MADRPVADFWFDPVCPWAWMTSRWMDEVSAVRDVDVRWHVMSLSILNSGRELPERYQDLMDRAWTPVRVVTAARLRHGDEVVKPLYDAIGTRIHPKAEKDFRAAVQGGLAEVGLPPELLRAADDPSEEVEAALRESHSAGIDLVGEEVGTPIVAFEGTAFFGPVVTPAPRGEAAGRLWDGCLLVAATPGFYELKRSREQGPIFD